MSQDLKCFFGVHKYSVLEQKDIKNSYGIVVGSTVISVTTHNGIKTNAYIIVLALV